MLAEAVSALSLGEVHRAAALHFHRDVIDAAGGVNRQPCLQSCTNNFC